jgi:membrane protease YdiL (CAAX protease family)
MKKPSSRSVLYLSLIIILLGWLIKIVQTLFGKSTALDVLNLRLQDSLPLTSVLVLVYGLFLLGLVVLLLYFSGERFRDLGFGRERLLSQIGRGALFGLIIFVIDTFLSTPLLELAWPQTSAESAMMKSLFSRLSFIPLWLFLSVFKGGLVEEVWRIFILTRFEKIAKKAGLIVALILGSFVFGLGHAYQGTAAVFSTALLGFFFALVFLRKRLALEAVSAHAAFDIIGISLGFILYFGR